MSPWDWSRTGHVLALLSRPNSRDVFEAEYVSGPFGLCGTASDKLSVITPAKTVVEQFKDFETLTCVEVLFETTGKNVHCCFAAFCRNYRNLTN
eukprot:2899416-Amphidinium_carterae.1